MTWIGRRKKRENAEQRRRRRRRSVYFLVWVTNLSCSIFTIISPIEYREVWVSVYVSGWECLCKCQVFSYFFLSTVFLIFFLLQLKLPTHGTCIYTVYYSRCEWLTGLCLLQYILHMNYYFFGCFFSFPSTGAKKLHFNFNLKWNINHHFCNKWVLRVIKWRRWIRGTEGERERVCVLVWQKWE